MFDPLTLNDKTLELLGAASGSVVLGAILSELGIRLGDWIDACFHRPHKTRRTRNGHTPKS